MDHKPPLKPGPPRVFRPGELRPGGAGKLEEGSPASLAQRGFSYLRGVSWKGLAVSLGIHAAILTAIAWVTLGGIGGDGEAAPPTVVVEEEEEVLLPVMMPPPKPPPAPPEIRPTVPFPRHSFPRLVFQRRLVVENEVAITLPEPTEVQGISLPPGLAARLKSVQPTGEVPPVPPEAEKKDPPAKAASGTGDGPAADGAKVES